MKFRLSRCTTLVRCWVAVWAIGMSLMLNCTCISTCWMVIIHENARPSGGNWCYSSANYRLDWKLSTSTSKDLCYVVELLWSFKSLPQTEIFRAHQTGLRR